MPYEVVGLLGRGGMAVVELAIDADGRRVARKRLPLTGAIGEMEVARRRLRREAQVLARLEHPGIVPLLGVEDDGADVILVMPAFTTNLSDRVRAEGRLSPSEVWRAGHVLLDALAWAHRQGVVHRDIKPANVLFDENGRPALADFGIAHTAEATHGLTAAGSLLGTPGFIAPEQARGEPAGPPSDVFSLGATLAYALTGHGPYAEGDAVTLALRAAKGEVRLRLDGVPSSLAHPLRSMLDPRPERRPSAAGLLGGRTGTIPGPDRAFAPGLLRLTGRRPMPPAPVTIPGLDRTRRDRPAHAEGNSSHKPVGISHSVGVVGDIAAQLPRERYLPPEPGARATRTTLASRLRRDTRTIARLLAGGPAPVRASSRRRPALLVAITAGLGIAGVVTWVGVALAGGPAGAASARSGHASTPTTLCAPLPYQVCGQPAAPHTDGLRCLPGWYDVDNQPANGCEATADGVDGQTLVAGQPLQANLVPVGEVDSYPLHVQGKHFFSCGGTLTVTLTAPQGVTDQVQLKNGNKIVAQAISSDGQPAKASVSKPSCFGNDPENFTVVVRGVVGATGADYTLTRTAGW